MRRLRSHLTAMALVTIGLVVHFKAPSPVKIFSRSHPSKYVVQEQVENQNHPRKSSNPSTDSMYKIPFRETTLDGEHSKLGLTAPELAKQVNFRKLWLRNFTNNIPTDLTLLLQDILVREFEKPNDINDQFRRCKHGQFRLPSMEKCHKWLGCNDIMGLKSEKMVGSGGVKTIHSAKWRGLHEIAIANVRKDRYQLQRYMLRAQAGIDNLLLSQPSPYTTQVVGYCVRGNYTVLAMESCKYGDFRTFYMGPIFRRLTVIEKFKFAIQFVAQFDYLHRRFGLPRVHCDMHNVMKAFNQFLVSGDLRLYMNDMDDMPEVDKPRNRLAGCKNEKQGVMSEPGFLAPEMRYTQEEYFNGTHKKPVDENSNTWKIPDLTANIMISNTSSLSNPAFALYETGFKYDLQDRLEPIHRRCKNINPEKRPTSREVLIFYLKIYKDLLRNSGEEK